MLRGGARLARPTGIVMSAAQWVVAVFGGLLPLGLLALVVWRSHALRSLWASWLGVMALAAVLVLPMRLVMRLLERWAEIDPDAGTGGQVTLLLYTLLVVAPLEMGLVTTAVLPFWRFRRVRMRTGLSRKLETREGVAFATTGALGFTTTTNFLYLLGHGIGWMSVARASLWLITFTLLCGMWGYVLGRYATRGMRSKRFSSAWVGATIFAAVCDQMIFRRGLMALVSVLPLVVSMLGVALVLWRDVKGTDTASSGRLSSLFNAAPAPSLTAIREAFRQQDRPVTLRWISFGALVTTGMITTGIAASVYIGHRVGLDFSAVDREEAGADGMVALAFLGAGALAAFPSAGYLLARASGTRSVLEPAVAASLAMVLMLVFMGMLAPSSVVFAIAFAPIAFVLSCVGAWVGLAN